MFIYIYIYIFQYIYIYTYRKRSNCRPGGAALFKKGGGNIETYCKTTVTKQNLKNDHIILHLHYFTLCRTCKYIPYIHVHISYSILLIID